MGLTWPLLLSLFLSGDQAATKSSAASVEPVSAILEIFRSHSIAAIAEEHGNEQGHAFRLSLIRDVGFAALVDDIVVECGNARYQSVMDRFVSGESVPYDELRQVWQNTTQPHTIWDKPIYEEFFHAVRAINAELPPARRLRVLLGDPPIDWNNIHSAADLRKNWGRSRYPADVIKREVLASGRRALVIYGGAHLWRQNPAGPTLVEHLETAGARVFTIMIHPGANLAAVQPDQRLWRAPSLTFTRGTSLANQVDAILYLGPRSAMTHSRLPARLCSDPGYREMRQGRMALTLGHEKAADALNKECGG